MHMGSLEHKRGGVCECTCVGICDGVSHGFLLAKKQQGLWSFEVSSSFVIDGQRWTV